MLKRRVRLNSINPSIGPRNRIRYINGVLYGLCVIGLTIANGSKPFRVSSCYINGAPKVIVTEDPFVLGFNLSVVEDDQAVVQAPSLEFEDRTLADNDTVLIPRQVVVVRDDVSGVSPARTVDKSSVLFTQTRLRLSENP